MRHDPRETGFWQDAREMPAALQATLDAREGFADVAELLGRDDVRRIVVTGNGAAWYAAAGLQLVSLCGEPAGAQVLAVPGGLVAKGGFDWREGDALLAISSSGEFRDVVEACKDPHVSERSAAITANGDSSVGRAARATAVIHVEHQRALTHTQAWCGELLAAFAVWAELTGDAAFAEQIAAFPSWCEGAIPRAEAWAEEQLSVVESPAAGVVFGSGPAWAGALEGALLLKEIPGIPSEGVETREGATSSMTGLAPGHLVLSMPIAGDVLVDEAEATCRATGATVVRVPGSDEVDPRLAALAAFPFAGALAAWLGACAGRNVDRPAWTDTYYATAR